MKKSKYISKLFLEIIILKIISKMKSFLSPPEKSGGGDYFKDFQKNPNLKI